MQWRIQGCKETPPFSGVLSPLRRSHSRSLRGVITTGVAKCVAEGGPPLCQFFSCEALATVQYRVDMWKSCIVDAVIAEGFALTGGCSCARVFALYKIEHYATCDWQVKRALRLHATWKASSSTQQWPAIVLLARLASKTSQRAFCHSQVAKTLMATS